MQRFVLVAAHLFAPRLAKCAPFFRRRPVHTAEHTLSTLAATNSEAALATSSIPRNRENIETARR
jgi:hypothetical protein